MRTTRENFSLTLSNRHAHRRGIVFVTVDGLNIIYGLDLNTTGIGYILEPNSETLLTGWYFGTYQNPSFQLGGVPQEYRDIMDQPTQVGTINASFHFEQSSPHYQSDYFSQSGLLVIHQQGSGWGNSNDQPQIVREQFAWEPNISGTARLTYSTST